MKIKSVVIVEGTSLILTTPQVGGVNFLLISESIENLKEKFFKWKEAFESKGLKVNLKKTKVMVSDLKDEVLKSKVDPCAKCRKRVMANSIMCTKVW